MTKGAKTPETFMVIEELQTIDSGEHAGDLVINVKATRGGKEHRLPYHINRRNVETIDLDTLKLKVIADIDALEAEANKRAVVINKLKLQVGKQIDLS